MKNALILLLIAITVVAQGQKKSSTILKANKQVFGFDEFEFVYNKNNKLSQNPLSAKEYLDLFVNYKLKVIEAEQEGLDTAQSFVSEFGYYRDELAKPYLNDKKVEEQVMREAYDRLQYEVDASHILIRLSQTPTPADTLKAYNKIDSLLKVIKGGESFESVAIRYSEDPSVKMNNGRLGYFTGFQLVYPFETAAYNTPVGQMSGIVRTQFGYHLIKVNDKRPSSGEILTAHIMKMFPYNSTEEAQAKAKVSIDSIYALVLAGEDFGALAQKYSDDKNSAENSGELPWFAPSRMIPEFSGPAFALQQNGDISVPIKTPYGWHIIKRIDKRGIAPYEEMKDEIQQRIGSDERQFAGQEAVLKRVKAESKYQQYPQNVDALTTLLGKSQVTDSLFFVEALKMTLPVATFGGKTLKQSDFANYLKRQRNFSVSTAKSNMTSMFDNFIKEELLAYEKEQLPIKYPEYRFLVNEYHDGLLIFEISQRKVWNKASADTTGLKQFFEAHRANYTKPEKWEGAIYYCNNEETYNRLKQNISGAMEQLPDSMLTAIGIMPSEIKYEKVNVAKGENSYIDKNCFNDAAREVVFPQGFTTALTVGVMKPAGLAELNEVRGQVLADYQNELERVWIAELHKKYKPQVNYKLLSKLTDAEKK